MPQTDARHGKGNAEQVQTKNPSAKPTGFVLKEKSFTA